MLWIIFTAYFSCIVLGIVSIIKIKKENFIKPYFLTYIWMSTIWLFFLHFEQFFESGILVRLLFGGAVFMTSSGVLFIKSYVTQKKASFMEIVLWYGVSVIVFFMSLKPGFMYNISFNPKLSIKFLPLSIFYFLFFSCSLFYSVYLTGIALTRFRAIVRLQARYIFMGIIGCNVVIFASLYILPLQGYSNFINLSALGIIIFALYSAYSIFRYNLFDMHIVVKRSSIYGMMGIFITIVYLSLMMIFEYISRGFGIENMIFFRIVTIAVIAILYVPFQSRLEKFFDRHFFPTYCKYNSAVKMLNEKIVSILELRNLIDAIIDSICDIFNVDQATLFIYDNDTKKYHLRAVRGFPEDVRSIVFTSKHFLVQWLRNEKKIWIQSMNSNTDERGYQAAEHYLDILKAEICVPLLFNNTLIGFIALGEKKQGDIFTIEELNLLDTLSLEVAIALLNAISYTELKRNFLGTIEALSKAIEFKDINTRGHVERVKNISIAIAKQMGCSRKDIEILQYSALLHDVGKISIDDSILKKKEKLTESEYQAVKDHPEKGENIINPIEFFGEMKTIIRHHHERWDGEGYPDNLKGNDIVLLSRILQVADSFDAMTSFRTYRSTLTKEEAIEELQRCSSKQFDPDIVDAFKKIYKMV